MRVYRGDIYLARLTSIIGSEQSSERPVLVIQNDVGNCYSPTTIIAPITSRTNKKPCMPTHAVTITKVLCSSPNPYSFLVFS